MATGVTEYTYDFSFIQSETGLSATRVFHYNPNSSTNGPNIPEPGDAFEFPDPLINSPAGPDTTSATIDGLICRQQDIYPLAGMPNIFKFVCQYNNEPVDRSIFARDGQEFVTPINELPVTVEYGGEYTMINPDRVAGWKFESSNEAIVQPIPFRVNQSTVRYKRYISNANYAGWTANVREMTGKVNQNPWQAYGAECLLFNSAPTEMIRNFKDEIWWKAEIEFLYRSPDGLDVNGWNLLLGLNGKWDRPINPSGGASPDNSLYLTTDNFDYLFNNIETS